MEVYFIVNKFKVKEMQKKKTVIFSTYFVQSLNKNLNKQIFSESLHRARNFSFSASDLNLLSSILNYQKKVTRPSSDSEAATMYKLKGQSFNMQTYHGLK